MQGIPGIYFCDPSKNRSCEKTICFFKEHHQGTCYSTASAAYAMLDEKGKPMRSPINGTVKIIQIDAEDTCRSE